jgi:hypothetical protein
MKFFVYRASEGSVSKAPPCKGAVRGPEADAWPGEYLWFIELANLEELLRFLEANGGGVGVFSAEEVGEDHPAIEIFDDDESDEQDDE